MIFALVALPLLLSAAALHHAEKRPPAVDAYLAPQSDVEGMPAPRIVGGSESPLGAFPYQVAVQRRLRGGDYQFTCGGAIIEPGKIITTARCGALWSYGDEFRVVAGDVDLSKIDGFEQSRNICSVSIHPRYKLRSLDYNYAILRLCTPLVFNAYVNAVPIAGMESASGTCQVSGWGNIRVGDDSIVGTPKLHNVTIPLVSRSNCSKKYEQVGVDITDRILCSEQQGTGICYGDSGASMVCEDGALLGVAIRNWEPCGKGLGLFANLPAERRWIDAQ